MVALQTVRLINIQEIGDQLAFSLISRIFF